MAQKKRLILNLFEMNCVSHITHGLWRLPGNNRGQVLHVRQADYIRSSVALGHTWWAVIRQHLFPNAMRPLVAMMTLGVGQSIVWASGLAFLGLGVAPPSPEWGALLDAGRAAITTSPWLEILPGLVIVLATLALTSLGRTLQHRLEGAAR